MQLSSSAIKSGAGLESAGVDHCLCRYVFTITSINIFGCVNQPVQTYTGAIDHRAAIGVVRGAMLVGIPYV